MLHERVVSRLLTWHLTAHLVNHPIKIFRKGKSTSFRVCTVRGMQPVFGITEAEE